MRIALVLLVACGAAPYTPAPVIIQDPPPRPTVPAAVSCGDAGVIMRGTVEHPKTAGPAKEAAIASACLLGKWSQQVLECVGSSPDPTECTAKLDAAQRELLDRRLKAWANAHDGESADPVSEDEAEVSCETGIGDVAAYTPALRLVAEELLFATVLRRHSVMAQCQDWANDVRLCFSQGKPSDDCRADLQPVEQVGLTDELSAIDRLMGQILKIKAKPPATYSCAAVVAQHYSDAAWKGKAELPKNPKATRAELVQQAQDRKQMIADSRKAMTDACTGEVWSATLRACELAGGGDQCAFGSNNEPRWGFPAEGVLVRTGISECDAYVRVQQALLRCDKVPAAAKDAMKQSLETQRQAWGPALADPNARSTIAYGCTQAEAALRQAAPALGCTI